MSKNKGGREVRKPKQAKKPKQAPVAAVPSLTQRTAKAGAK